MNNFYKGGRVHAYFKGILQSIHYLKNRCSKLRIPLRYPAAEYALENNIAHVTSVCFSSQYALVGRSSILGDSCVPDSGLVRQSLDVSSAVVRQFPKAQSKRSRTTPEQVSKRSRTSVEGYSNKPRTGFEEKAAKHPSRSIFKDFKSGASDGPISCLSGSKQLSNSGPIRTVFVLDSENIRPAKYPLITFQHPFLGQPMCAGCVGGVQEMGEVRSRYEGSTNPVPRMYCLSTGSSRGIHGKGTGNVLRSYWRATKEVLRSYWKGTAFSKLRVTSGRESGSSTSNGSRVVKGWFTGRLSIDQASVMRMLSVSKAWIVRKTVPVYALSTHYVSFIYASYLLNPYLKSVLPQISTSKPFKFLKQVFAHVECYNSLERLKISLNLRQGVSTDVEDKRVVRLFAAARFSIVSILLLFMTFGALISQAQNKLGYVLQGTVVSAEDKKPLQGVSVRVEAENIKISTKNDGTFSIPVAHRKGKVKFTNVGYKTVEQEYTSGVVLSMQLSASDNQLEEVEVVSTGFQKIPKERATGSFEFVDNKLLNQRVGSTILDRLENASVSTTFTKDHQWSDRSLYNYTAKNQFNIRGSAKMVGDAGMTVVLDNVIYEGDIRNINPNDIESVTILKDAVAASIWGTSAGEGVIVLTSKKGK